MPPPKFLFPVRNPLFDAEVEIVRSAKTVQMIWHQEIISNQPGGGVQPHLAKQPIGKVIGKPRNSPFCGNGEKYEVRSAKLEKDSRGRVFTTRFGKRIRTSHSCYCTEEFGPCRAEKLRSRQLGGAIVSRALTNLEA